MQTFIPEGPDFLAGALCLDKKRLGNQCWREAKTLYSGGWPNHPASKMWKGYRPALAEYGLALAEAMCIRGWYSYSTREKWHNYWLAECSLAVGNYELPTWLYDHDVINSHRAALLYKDFEWYSQFNWPVEPDQPTVNPDGSLTHNYIWPKESAA